jgi:hypothetical protein
MPGDDGWVGNPLANSATDIVSDTIIDVIGRSILG